MLVALSGVARSEDGKSKAATNPTFEKLKKLVGTWVETDKDGRPTQKIASIIRLTAGGSAVHETLFPGDDMEMISVYHLNKDDVLMTHYCMLGNQPRMKADPASPPNKIRWVFTGGTNLDPSKDAHMHGFNRHHHRRGSYPNRRRSLGRRQAIRGTLRLFETSPQEVGRVSRPVCLPILRWAASLERPGDPLYGLTRQPQNEKSHGLRPWDF